MGWRGGSNTEYLVVYTIYEFTNGFSPMFFTVKGLSKTFDECSNSLNLTSFLHFASCQCWWNDRSQKFIYMKNIS